MVRTSPQTVHTQPALNGQADGPRYVRASTLGPVEDVDWIFKPYVPLCLPTLIQGPKGTGKTSLIAYLIKVFQALKRGPALYYAGEEDFHRLVQPRLEAAGVAMGELLVRHGGRRQGPGRFTLPDGAAELERVVRGEGVGLVAFDPMAPYIGASRIADPGARAREALGPLLDLGELNGLTNLWVQHVGKDPSKKGINKGLGTVELANVARWVLQLQRTTSSPTGFLLSGEEVASGEKPPSLAYRLEGGLQRGCFVPAGTVKAREELDTAALDASSEGKQIAAFRRLIRLVLKQGKQKASYMRLLWEKNGIGKWSAYRAAELEHVQFRPGGKGNGRGNYWELPHAK